MTRELILTTLVAMPAAVLLGSASRAAAAPPVPTFTRDVAPIFYRHCTTCHRPGQIAPMSLLTYRDARPWSRAIRARVAARTMPPSFAEEGHVPLANERRLNDNELMTILMWVDGGAVEGNRSDLPAAPDYVDDAWRIGTPDAVFELPRAVSIPASGFVDVQYFEVPTGLTTDRWIQAIEIRPGDPGRVHQVRLYYREAAPGGRPDPVDETVTLGHTLAQYASGADPLVFPDGAAMRLPGGSTLVFEVHYATNGVAGADRTRMALRYAEEPPAEEVRAVPVAESSLLIPSGAPSHRVETRLPFEGPASILSITPHGHRRAKSFEYRLVRQDGRSETILSVPRYNWLWETSYQFADPIAVTAGTTLEIAAIYDNSPANKANPNPRADVGWGWDPVTQEMMSSCVVVATRRR
jgi:hypothetical protein